MLTASRRALSVWRGDQFLGHGSQKGRLESLTRRFSDKSSGDGDSKKPWFQSLKDAMNETKEK